MIKFEYEGKEYEFRGGYEVVKEGDYFIPCNQLGCVSKASRGDEVCAMTRAIVHPVEKYHTFGGVKFRETGEVRMVQLGEWYLFDMSVGVGCRIDGHVISKHPILEVIGI